MADTSSLLEAGVDALSTEVGVLDTEGAIVYTNEAWQRFAESNDDRETLVETVGVNYLDVTEQADDPHARQAATGLRAVLAGEREEFSLEYPCHSPDERRWFLLRASGFDCAGEWYVLVTHQNITDRKLAELDAERRNERLETVASVLAHDLRNPLAVALGFVEMLREEDEDGDERLGRVESALERMEDIIENALVLARHDAVEETRPVDLKTLAERVWHNVQTEAATLEIEATTVFRADPDLLEHVFENLFRNAVEHSSTSPDSQSRQDAVEHADPDVTVRVGPLEDEPGFYVEDDGPGIPESDRERVFERGFTLGGDGTGLGLDIVSQISDAHDWDVRVTESDEGGARFEFTGVDPAR